MAESKLREVQSWFWRSIAGEPGEYDFESELVEAIEPSRTQEPAQRLEVYADAYYLRLRDVLAEDFPRVAQLLGDEDFAHLVRGYLKAHPSTEPSVRHLGRALAEFIRAHDDSATVARRPCGFGMGPRQRLRRSRRRRAAHHGEAGRTRFAAWPHQKLVAVRSLETLTASWPVHRLWAAEGNPEAVEADVTSIRVWRGKDFHVFHAPMDTRESAAISRLLAGASFAELCQVFEDLEEQQAAQEAGALLVRWLEDGIIARVE